MPYSTKGVIVHVSGRRICVVRGCGLALGSAQVTAARVENAAGFILLCRSSFSCRRTSPLSRLGSRCRFGAPRIDPTRLFIKGSTEGGRKQEEGLSLKEALGLGLEADAAIARAVVCLVVGAGTEDIVGVVEGFAVNGFVGKALGMEPLAVWGSGTALHCLVLFETSTLAWRAGIWYCCLGIEFGRGLLRCSAVQFVGGLRSVCSIASVGEKQGWLPVAGAQRMVERNACDAVETN
jgi:hypothetical protein